jgi:hypothetical protein
MQPNPIHKETHMTSEQDLSHQLAEARTLELRARKRLQVACAIARCHPESPTASNDKLVEVRRDYDDAVRHLQHVIFSTPNSRPRATKS